MSDNNPGNNPFLGLFDSVSEAKTFLHENGQSENSSPSEDSTSKSSDLKEEKETLVPDPADDALNILIQDIFYITASKHATSKPLVFVEETAAALETPGVFDIGSLEQALFERLLLEDPGRFVVAPASLGNAAIDHHVIEKEVLTYLFDCYKHLVDQRRWRKDMEDALALMGDLVIRNFVTALISPEIYGNQQLHLQFINMFNDYAQFQDSLTYLVKAAVKMIVEDSGSEDAIAVLSKLFYPILDEIKECTENCTLFTLKRHVMNLVQCFSSIPELGKICLIPLYSHVSLITFFMTLCIFR